MLRWLMQLDGRETPSGPYVVGFRHRLDPAEFLCAQRIEGMLFLGVGICGHDTDLLTWL